MVDLTNLTSINFDAVITQLSSVSRIFQAIGGLVIVYIVFWIINMFHNWKKEKEIRRIRELLEEINRKIKKK